MTSDPNLATEAGLDSVVVASFDSDRHAEHMLVSLGHGFRKRAREGRTTVVVVTGKPDGSLTATQSRVVTASGVAATGFRVSLAWTVGFMGLFSTAKEARAGAHAVKMRQGHVGAEEHRAHQVLTEAGPHAAIVLVRTGDPDTRQLVAARAADKARDSWDGSTAVFLAALNPGRAHDWVRASMGEAPGPIR